MILQTSRRLDQAKDSCPRIRPFTSSAADRGTYENLRKKDLPDDGRFSGVLFVRNPGTWRSADLIDTASARGRSLSYQMTPRPSLYRILGLLFILFVCLLGPHTYLMSVIYLSTYRNKLIPPLYLFF